MVARIFCLDTLHLRPFRTPQISAGFQSQHHAYGCRSLNLRQSLRWQKGRGLAIKCVDGDRLLTRPKDEIDEEDQCDGMAEEDATEKVELLEMEAIMGKDDGREAMDYKRRAGIFYKSSEMFQAIKKDDQHQQGSCVGS